MVLVLEREELKKEQSERREREEAARRAYLRKLSALRAEIRSLENLKSQYVSFKSSLSTLSSNLSELSKNLGYSSEYLSLGLALDNKGGDSGSMQDTSILAGNYATTLSNNNQIIEDKIRTLDSSIRAKKSELSNLSM